MGTKKEMKSMKEIKRFFRLRILASLFLGFFPQIVNEQEKSEHALPPFPLVFCCPPDSFWVRKRKTKFFPFYF